MVVQRLAAMCDWCNRIAMSNCGREDGARYMARKYNDFISEGDYDFCDEDCQNSYHEYHANPDESEPVKFYPRNLDEKNKSQKPKKKRKRKWLRF